MFSSLPDYSLSDHSLQSDAYLQASSPNSVHMYDAAWPQQPYIKQEPMDDAPPAPQLLGLCVEVKKEPVDDFNLDEAPCRDPVWSPTTPGLKKEAVFQHPAHGGDPTLSELNASDSLMDDLQSIITREMGGSDMVESDTFWEDILRAPDPASPPPPPPPPQPQPASRAAVAATLRSEAAPRSAAAAAEKPRLEAAARVQSCSVPGVVKREKESPVKETPPLSPPPPPQLEDDAEEEATRPIVVAPVMGGSRRRYESETQESVESEYSDVESDDDLLSEVESVGSDTSLLEDESHGKKKQRRYFWQYNTQAKGPKGKRLCKVMPPNDPHVLYDFEDPVFDPSLNQNKYKHSGKARKGDGNDVKPNPYRLCQLGNELKKLNKTIDDMSPVNDMPLSQRAKIRKEKNKFASRACRLKKKAQHEANKIKLFGLEREHYELVWVIKDIKREMVATAQQPAKKRDKMLPKMERLLKNYKTRVATKSTDYVNDAIRCVLKGDRTGGLK